MMMLKGKIKIINLLDDAVYAFINAYRDFEAVATYCSGFTSTLPLVMLLGFFTSTAMQVLENYVSIFKNNTLTF